VFGDYCAIHGRPDVIHAHNFKYSAFFADALSDVYGVPYVYTEHSSEILSGSMPKAAGSILRRVIERSSATTAVSSALRDSMCDLTGLSDSKIQVIPNMLPVEFVTVGVRDSCEARGFRFVNVAEALPVKRQALLIQAFAKYFKNTKARLTIIGEGPELKALERLAVKLEVSSKVELLGRLPRVAIREVLLRSDCFVLSSRHETFAVAAIEALSQGLPVVSTRCGGPLEFIDPENGMLAVSDSIDGIGQAMVAVQTNRHLYNSTRISERCISAYSPARVVASYLRVYERALKC
jgi:glycosyltransferase involved in cell wall biosynthesis